MTKTTEMTNNCVKIRVICPFQLCLSRARGKDQPIINNNNCKVL